MTFDYPAFNGGSDNLSNRSGSAASDLTSGVTSNLAPPGAASPVGNTISMLTGQLQGGLSNAGPTLKLEGTTTNTKTHSALAAIDAQDEANAAQFPNGDSAAGAAAPAPAGDAAGDVTGAAGEVAADAAGAADELDPASIDQEAREKAEKMLGGDQMGQQMSQMLGQAAQAGAQAGQQVSQQLNQIGQQLGQGLQQAGQKLGELVGKAVGGGGIATPDLGLDGLGGAGIGGSVPDLGGAGGIPDFGGGGAGDFGGAGGVGDIGGAGIGGDTTVGAGMTTSPALLPSPLAPPGTGSQNNTATRVPMAAPMMPMMPMAGRGAQGDNADTTKRDPVIFAERPLYEATEGVEQVIGARPEIESEEPPFGTGTEAAAH
jgi:hypothetical protein